MEVKSRMVKLIPYGAMVMVECLDVGLTTLGKSAMSKGMNHFVFVVYSNALATVILFPTSIILQRKKKLPPPITFSLLCKFFLLSLVGLTIVQNCVYTGLSYSSPTLASALSNLIPAFTFLLALVFRMEKLDLGSSRSQIKVMATIVSISGALIVTLYKGPVIIARLMESPSMNLAIVQDSWVIGGLFITVACLSVALWNTFQVSILKGYPSEMTIVSFYCLFGTIQSAVIALVATRDPKDWKLKNDIELIAIVYSAVFGSCITYSVQIWCIHNKGPVFVAMFKPLGIAIAALMSVIFLGDMLYVGSVIGAVIIAAGFYGVIVAQSKEEPKCEKHYQIHKIPLLHSSTLE